MSSDPSLLAEADQAELLAGVSAWDVDCLEEIFRRHASSSASP